MAVKKRVVSGRLFKRITFYAPNKIQDQMGQMREVPKVVYGLVPANIQAMGGISGLRGEQVEENVTHLVETRFLHGLLTTPDMWIEELNFPPGAGAIRRLNIIRTVDPNGYRTKLLHYCKEVPLANGN